MRIGIIIIAIIFTSCSSTDENQYVHKVDWSQNLLEETYHTGLKSKLTYLPIYSDIYIESDKATIDLTASVSIHNMNLQDSLFIYRADYYNSKGELLRKYIDQPIYLRPMETVHIVIHGLDNKGGTGANFLVEWKKNNVSFNPPLIEGVMISTFGQQGISFTTRGVILD